MELIVISHTKVKIMLTLHDMNHYGLSAHSLDYGDVHTRQAFRHILDDAATPTGFDTKGERLFIQFYNSKDGGCEIFVTKLGKGTDAEQSVNIGEKRLLACIQENEENDAYDETEAAMPMTKSSSILPVFMGDEGNISLPVSGETMIFLDEMSVLLSLCHRLLQYGFEGESMAYIHESRKTYYLYLREGETLVDLVRLYPFITEYGHISTNSAWMLYVKEHAEIICDKGAVETLGVL